MSKVSVIVPVYNVENYLERCLESLVNQTLEDIEIIVVNDGSTDNSQNIIDRYKKAYPKKIVSLRKKNGGLGDARNYGLKYASGEYIGFVDSDDWVNKETYEYSYKVAVEKKLDIVIYDIIFEPNLKKLKMELEEDIIYSLKKNKKLLLIDPSVCNKIYKSDLFKQNNIIFPNNIFHEDRPTIVEILYYSERVGYVNKYFYHYLKGRQNSITTQINEKKFIDIINALNMIEKFLKDKDIYEEYREIFIEIVEKNYINFSIKAIAEYKSKLDRNVYLDSLNDYCSTIMNKPGGILKNEVNLKYKIITILLIKKRYNIVSWLIKTNNLKKM